MVAVFILAQKQNFFSGKKKSYTTILMAVLSSRHLYKTADTYTHSSDVIIRESLYSSAPLTLASYITSLRHPRHNIYQAFLL